MNLRDNTDTVSAKNKKVVSRTMLVKRHQRIAKLFDEPFFDTMKKSGGKNGL